jgi:hypothetical protein
MPGRGLAALSVRFDPAMHIIAVPKAVRKEQDGGFIKNETRGTMKP